MNDQQENKRLTLSANEEFPNDIEMLNESFDSEDQKTPEEVKNNIANFWSLDPLRQKKYVRNFSSICQLLGHSEFLFIVDKLYSKNKTSCEARPEVTNLLMDNLELLFKILSNNPLFQNDEKQKYAVEKIVLDFLGELIESNVSNLLVSSRKALVKTGPMLSRSSCDNDLLSIILTLLHDPKSESNKTSALDMIKQMNMLFSDDYIRGFIAMDIIALMQSPSVNIRIEACHSLFSLFHVFTSEFVESRFVPVIEVMSQDSNSAVINHLIKNMPALAKKISFNQFEKRFFPKFMEYLNSKNRFQREESLGVLGSLIVSFIESEDETHVFSVYSSSHFDKLLDTYFDLPKVVAKMNLVTKRNIIKSNYSLLDKIVLLKKNDIWAKIKRLILGTEEIETVLIETAKIEVSLKLNCIAKVCDKLTLEKDLIVIIDKYYLTVNPTTSQTVKQNTIKVLSEVLKELSPEIREKYADVYQTTLNLEVHKWRLRYVISEQIDSLSKLFSPETIFTKIIPMYFSFCRDNCAVVRKSASKLFHKLYQNIMHDENSKQIAILNMKSFGSYNRFVLRQSFVLMAECLLLNMPSAFDDEMVTILHSLSQDKVVNVRLAVARLLVNLHKSGLYFPFIDQIRKTLQDQVDNDMYQLLKEITPQDQMLELESAFQIHKGTKLKAAREEKERIEGLRPNNSKSTDKGKANVPVDDASLRVVSTNAYRDLLKNAFEIGKNDNAKELIDDLNLGDSNPELDKKFSDEKEPQKSALQPFVDIDLHLIKPEGTKTLEQKATITEEDQPSKTSEKDPQQEEDPKEEVSDENQKN